MKDITMQQFIAATNRNNIRKQLIPMEMSSGWPALSIKNHRLCVTLPYFKTAPNGDGAFNLFPLAYGLTLLWETGTIVQFTRYSFTKEFREVDYAKAVGTFKHKAIQDMRKDEYIAKRTELFALYDALASSILEQRAFAQEEQLRTLLSLLMEPSLLPFYRKIAPKFFESYYIK